MDHSHVKTSPLDRVKILDKWNEDAINEEMFNCFLVFIHGSFFGNYSKSGQLSKLTNHKKLAPLLGVHTPICSCKRLANPVEIKNLILGNDIVRSRVVPQLPWESAILWWLCTLYNLYNNSLLLSIVRYTLFDLSKRRKVVCLVEQFNCECLDA